MTLRMTAPASREPKNGIGASPVPRSGSLIGQEQRAIGPLLGGPARAALERWGPAGEARSGDGGVLGAVDRPRAYAREVTARCVPMAASVAGFCGSGEGYRL